MPEAGPAEPKAEPASHRNLLHLVVVNFSSVSQFYKDKIEKDLEHFNADTPPLIKKQIEEGIMLCAYKLEYNAFDLIDQLQGVMKYLPADQKIGVTLHTGVIHKAESNLTGEALDTAIELNKLSLAGVIVSEFSAALLALQVNKYAMDYAGTIVTKPGKKYSIYRVSMATKK